MLLQIYYFGSSLEAGVVVVLDFLLAGGYCCLSRRIPFHFVLSIVTSDIDLNRYLKELHSIRLSKLLAGLRQETHSRSTCFFGFPKHLGDTLVVVSTLPESTYVPRLQSAKVASRAGAGWSILQHKSPLSSRMRRLAMPFSSFLVRFL